MTDSLAFDGKGGSSSPLFIMSNTTWNLKCSGSWLSASAETGGNFSQVTISAKENTDTSERKGAVTITVQGLPLKIIAVAQKAASAN
jgi:hypothetical protein